VHVSPHMSGTHFAVSLPRAPDNRGETQGSTREMGNEEDRRQVDAAGLKVRGWACGLESVVTV